MERVAKSCGAAGVALACLTALGCGGRSGIGHAAPDLHSIGGEVEGLSDTVVLRQGSDRLTISEDGPFVFPTRLQEGDHYRVEIAPQAEKGPDCVVLRGVGVVGTSDVRDVRVVCGHPLDGGVDGGVDLRTVGGTVSGLEGALVLQNNGGDDLTVTSDGVFTFATRLPSGDVYDVTILIEPPDQACVIGSASGTVGGENVTDVFVPCTTWRTVGGAVTGLSGGTLVLRNNGVDELTIVADGPFAFPTRLLDGSSYDVTVASAPAGQVCTVSNGAGLADDTDVTDVLVTCNGLYTVGGTVTGLAGTLMLQNNGGDDLAIVIDGGFTFATTLPDGSAYDVTIAMQPGAQTCAVANGSGVLAGAPVTDALVTCETILAGPVPRYPAHGSDWNDYVRNDGTGPLDASDTACDAENDGPDYFACLHAGEIRAVELPGRADCTGLSAIDDLGAFDWVCDAGTTPVRMVSTGLRDDGKLSDLLDFDAASWRPNVVRVYDGAALVGRTQASVVWWNNPVVANPTDEDLTDDRTIYLLTEPNQFHTLWADRGAIVVEPGVTLAPPPGTVLAVIGADFTWIEGSVDAGGEFGISVLGSAHFSVVRNSIVRNASLGISIDAGASKTLVSHVAIGDVSTAGIGVGVYVQDSPYAAVRRLTVDCPSGGAGVWVRRESIGVSIDSLTTFGCDPGVWLYDVEQARVSNVTAVGDVFGLYLESVWGGRFWNVRVPALYVDDWYGPYGTDNTFWNLQADLVWSWATGQSRYSGVLDTTESLYLFRNAYVNVTAILEPLSLGELGWDNVLLGVAATRLEGSELEGLTADNLAAMGAAGTPAIRLTAVNDGKFHGLLKVGGNVGAECSIAGGMSPGLVDDAVGDTNCGIEGASTATIVGSTSIADSFVGPVMTDDAVNTSDIDGAAAYEAIIDWSSFENEWRAWRDEATGWMCGPDDLCRIWDWSLRASDTVLRDVLAPPVDGNDYLRLPWSGIACWELTGSSWDAAAGECVSHVLRNAVERMLDGIGNENLLCESGETCVFTPNIGAYQGHGELVPLSTIGAGGTIENVTLLRNEFNGR